MIRRLLLGMFVLFSSMTNVANAALELVITDGIDSVHFFDIMKNGSGDPACDTSSLGQRIEDRITRLANGFHISNDGLGGLQLVFVAHGVLVRGSRKLIRSVTTENIYSP